MRLLAHATVLAECCECDNRNRSSHNKANVVTYTPFRDPPSNIPFWCSDAATPLRASIPAARLMEPCSASRLSRDARCLTRWSGDAIMMTHRHSG